MSDRYHGWPEAAWRLRALERIRKSGWAGTLLVSCDPVRYSYLILCGVRTLPCAFFVPYPVRYAYLILGGVRTLSWAVCLPYPVRYAYLILGGIRTSSCAVFVHITAV